MVDRREEQIEREGAARDAALGRRLASLREGNLGPVIRRWVNADIQPMADLLRKAAVLYGSGDMAGVAAALDTPASQVEVDSGEKPLQALLQWSLRGRSPGRAGTSTTFADDLCLAFMGTILPMIAASGDKPRSIAACLAHAADSLRDTCLGQFITSVQGASAMQAVRERNPELWMQKKALNRICAQLASQVRPQLNEEERGLRVLATRGHKKVLTVMDHKGRGRMVSLVPPDQNAWEVMSLCWSPEDGVSTHPERSRWLAFAAMLLAVAQRTGGWFDVTETRTHRKGHTRKTKHLVLSDQAHEAIKRDAERWLGLGFQAEPMLVPPEDGDYLTVKHHKITGQRSPKGLTTQPEETDAWALGASALANTAWTVNPSSLDNLPAGMMEAPAVALRTSAHRRMGTDPFYLPVTMDFRGRIYYRTPWVSPQSGDLGKSLLCFPLEGAAYEGKPVGFDHLNAIAMHMTGLYGGPDKLDKAPLPQRFTWWWDQRECPDLSQADKPLTFKAHWDLIQSGQTDRIPIQLDGTCNGLQHLSALFRDEEAAKHVNLVRSNLDEPPADIYGVVAKKVQEFIHEEFQGTAPMWVGNPNRPEWMTRMAAAGIPIDRKLCKGPVMVLPYGGTREAVRLSVKARLLEVLEGTTAAGPTGPWRSYDRDQYAAFQDRELHDHPLFNQDVGNLSGLIWDCIAPVIPRAMAAMQTLQSIGSWVGERGLSWRVGAGPEERRLWVTQAKSKAQRKQVTMRGFHLPGMVRRLTLNANANEVDPQAHRTGIVANFIHSQDAAHLAASVGLFRARGGTSVGSVHDCVMVRPSEAKLMGECLREAFVELYTVPGDAGYGREWFEGPLGQPVRLLKDKDTIDVEFPSWHHLADAAGVSFPELGSFDINEVRDSAWFFS